MVKDLRLMLIWANLPIPFVELYLVQVPTYFLVCLYRRCFLFNCSYLALMLLLWTECYWIMSMYVFLFPIHGR
jgi:hypothetical protein